MIADATGGDALTGAVIGGAAGVFCDDMGVCKQAGVSEGRGAAPTYALLGVA